MKKTILTFGIIFLLVCISFSPSVAILNSNVNLTIDKIKQQPLSGTFLKTYGGSDYDMSQYVLQTTDGGYIIAGLTYSFGAGDCDIWLFKTDSNGNMVWDRTFGGPDYDDCWCIQKTTDGGYIISGVTYTNSAGESDIWLIKIDSSGNKIWDRTYGGVYHEYGRYAQQTIDGGYIITGYTKSFGTGEYDVWLIKTNSTGDKTWDKTFGGTKDDNSWCVQQTSDGGYIITGYTESFGTGKYDVWLIKTNSTGDKIWDRIFGGTDYDYSRCVQQTTDGGYIIAGFTESFGAGNDDIWLIKTDNNGNMKWNKTYGGKFSDYCLSVQQTNDGGYILTGDTASYGAGYNDFWLIKTDSNGNKTWDRTYGGVSIEEGRCVQQTTDGGYIITGIKVGVNYDIWLIKTDKDGRPRNKAITSNMLSPKIIERFSLLNHLLDIWRYNLL